MTSSRYDERSIRVLKGLEPVKERPGMYTRTDTPLHIIQEVVDNAADEALAGAATMITVTLHADRSVSVEDDGRGIPVGPHPEEKVPTVEVVFTRLHAGGKFDKKTGGSAYAFSGGLHGVGVSVTNALSKRLEVRVKRDGVAWALAFEDGFLVDKLRKTGTTASKQTGTWVRAWPDARYFDSDRIKRAELEHLLRAKAVLLPGLAMRLTDEATGDTVEWKYEGGMAAYLQESLAGEEGVASPVIVGESYCGEGDPQFAQGEGAAWALAWCESGGGGESYVNLIPTVEGGTHESGLKSGVFDSIREFCLHHELLTRGVTLQTEDVWKHLRFVLSTRMLDPQFQGQTKAKLNSRDAVKLVASRLKDPLDAWLNQHVEAGKKIAELAIRAAVARQKAGKATEKRRGSGVAVLPGKLTDCESEEIARNELFLVEGDSAGGSARQGRDRHFQAILPLRGKILNTFEVDPTQIYANNEVHDIAVALGIEPHAIPEAAKALAGLRYGKVIIMADADVDGSHIQTLLLALFFRHFPGLLANGHIFVAQPPLYCVKVDAQGKSRPERRLYALDEAERDAILLKLEDEKVRESAVHVGRFKGLGEMNPEELRETTMSPDTRRLLPLTVSTQVLADTHRVFTLLMGKGEAASRRSWLEERGNLVEADI
ncbi:MAG: type IIA DNA topoisomerase subunit B [Betaproteobacteria bacterium]|nr:type IIA DNA topoisomerase subunit B [Betaproteobacteria bacterium]